MVGYSEGGRKNVNHYKIFILKTQHSDSGALVLSSDIRRNGLVNEVKFLGLAHTFATM